MGKIYIYKNGMTPHKTIETDLPLDEVIVSGSIISFFRNLTPKHTGSFVSGSIESIDSDEYFQGEFYSFDDF